MNICSWPKFSLTNVSYQTCWDKIFLRITFCTNNSFLTQKLFYLKSFLGPKTLFDTKTLLTHTICLPKLKLTYFWLENVSGQERYVGTSNFNWCNNFESKYLFIWSKFGKKMGPKILWLAGFYIVIQRSCIPLQILTMGGSKYLVLVI